MSEKFTGSFTQQEPIPQAGIDAAVRVMQSGRLHRYNVAAGEVDETALLEQEFADVVGAKYALAVASGGYALATALRALGVGAGDIVLTNAFTLAPVPGAIASVGAHPQFVDVTENLTIDLRDLAEQIAATGAGYLMLSHMRGHICDMDRLMRICDASDVTVIEDCAHTMGAAWRGVASGRHGHVACYSTQTYKHMNSGEGGLIVSDDPDVMARAILLSGSYMMFERHRAAPPLEHFEALQPDIPNISGRMDNLRAAILRPQLASLGDQCAAWTERYRVVEDRLRDTPGLRVIERHEDESFVGSSIQFLLPNWAPLKITSLIDRLADRGVELKWFGAEKPAGFTSRYDSWRYARPRKMPRTDRVLAGLIDMRLPLTFSLEDCALIARIIRSEVGAVYQSA